LSEARHTNPAPESKEPAFGGAADTAPGSSTAQTKIPWWDIFHYVYAVLLTRNTASHTPPTLSASCPVSPSWA